MGESVRALLNKGDIYIKGSSTFLSIPANLGRCCEKCRLLIVNGYGIDVMTCIHMKLLINGGSLRYLIDVGYRGDGVIQNSDFHRSDDRREEEVQGQDLRGGKKGI